MRRVERAEGRRVTGAVLAAVLAVMVLALAACGGDDSSSSGGGGGGGEGSGPEKTSLKVGILKITDVYPIWVAQKEGFFKEVGIDNVQVTEMAGGAAIQPAIQSGQLDLGWSNVVSVVISKPRGFNFKFFAGGTWIGPDAERNQVILVKKNSPITDVKQLEGKRYGVNTLGNIAELSVRAYLDEQGVDLNKVKIVELGSPITVPPLVQGRVDAVSANEPAVTIGLQGGKVRILAENPYSALGEEVFLAGWIANDKFLNENPKTVKAFSQAISKAVAWSRDEQNKEEFTQLLAQNTGLAPDVVDKQVMSITKDQVTAADIQPWIDASKKYGLLKETFPPEDVLWQEPAK
jgi:NitT/TauT family transport system substrate-binding protein